MAYHRDGDREREVLLVDGPRPRFADVSTHKTPIVDDRHYNGTSSIAPIPRRQIVNISQVAASRRRRSRR
jgi:hypothetical protein